MNREKRLLNFKKCIWRIVDFFEIGIPSFSFLILFVVFIIQVLYRYVFNHPLTWPYEITVFSYIWVVIFSAAHARRKRKNIAFTMVYDKCSLKGKTIMRIIGNTFILISFVLLFVPAVKQIAFYQIRKSTILKFPFSYVYSPFAVFMTLVIVYSLIDLVRDINSIKNHAYNRDENDNIHFIKEEVL